MALEPQLIRARLDALSSDLQRMPLDQPCAWPVARVFNSLLGEARERLDGDPVVASMSSLKVQPADESGESANAVVGTVLVLAGQVRQALDQAQGGGGSGQSGRRR